jgi:hypothetical protein
VEHEQRFASDAFADVPLADGRELVAALGVGQCHVQLAYLQHVHVGDGQFDEHVEHLGQQRGGTAHGNVDGFAERVIEVHGQVGAELAAGAFALPDQAATAQGSAQLVGIGRLFQESSGAQGHDPADGFVLHVARHHDDLGLELFLLNGSQHFVAVHLGHGKVEQHHLAQPLADGIQPQLAVLGLSHGEFKPLRQGPQQLLARHVRIVTNQQRYNSH